MASLGITEYSLIFLLFILPTIFYLRALSKTLNKCTVENRKIQPNDVWLLLIPLFNLIYLYIVVFKISTTLTNEYAMRGIAKRSDMGKTVGLILCVLVSLNFIFILKELTYFYLPALICMIIHKVQLSNLTKVISQYPLDILPNTSSQLDSFDNPERDFQNNNR